MGMGDHAEWRRGGTCTIRRHPNQFTPTLKKPRRSQAQIYPLSRMLFNDSRSLFHS